MIRSSSAGVKLLVVQVEPLRGFCVGPRDRIVAAGERVCFVCHVARQVVLGQTLGCMASRVVVGAEQVTLASIDVRFMPGFGRRHPSQLDVVLAESARVGVEIKRPTDRTFDDCRLQDAPQGLIQSGTTCCRARSLRSPRGQRDAVGAFLWALVRVV